MTTRDRFGKKRQDRKAPRAGKGGRARKPTFQVRHATAFHRLLWGCPGILLCSPILWSGEAGAQDAVRLRSGKVIAGTITMDSGDREGFSVHPWDSGGTLHIRWDQIPEAEKERLQGRSADGARALDLMAGIRVVTPSRCLVGLLVKEGPDLIEVKTSASRSPAVVPVKALMGRQAIKIREDEAYSAEEMIEARAKKAGEKDSEALLEVGRFAAWLRRYEEAREYFQKAKSADPARQEEIDRMIQENDLLIRHGKAATLLAEVRTWTGEAEYPKAIEAAKKLLAEYGDTDLARDNPDLPARLEKEAQDFQTRRGEVLAGRIPDAYKSEREALFSHCAESKLTLSDARAMAGHIDLEIREILSKKLKCTPDEVAQCWIKREKKDRMAFFGAGSWIVLGGQDGGLDTDAHGQVVPPGFVEDQQTDGDGNTYRVRRRPDPVDVALGKELDTSEKWWANRFRSERRSWVEAEYARTSAAIEKIKEEARKCSACQGLGTVRTTRSGIGTDVMCPRCHGAKQDLVIRYQ